MIGALARFLYEHSLFDEFWSAFLVGFCVVGTDGQVYLTKFGTEYLEGL